VQVPGIYQGTDVARAVLLIRGAMGVPRNCKLPVVALFVVAGLSLGACGLNPQPLPPGSLGSENPANASGADATTGVGGESSSGGGSSGSSGSSGGSSSGGFATSGGDGGTATPVLVEDAGTPTDAAAMVADAGSDGGNVEADGGDGASATDASLDAPND
jgi:hypothetical protein